MLRDPLELLLDQPRVLRAAPRRVAAARLADDDQHCDDADRQEGGCASVLDQALSALLRLLGGLTGQALRAQLFLLLFTRSHAGPAP